MPSLKRLLRLHRRLAQRDGMEKKRFENQKQLGRLLVEELKKLSEFTLLTIMSVVSKFPCDVVRLACSRWAGSVSKQTGIGCAMLNTIAAQVGGDARISEFDAGGGNDVAYLELMDAHELVSKLPKHDPAHLRHYRAFIQTMVACLQRTDASFVAVARVLSDFPDDVIRLGRKSIVRDTAVDPKILDDLRTIWDGEDTAKCSEIILDALDEVPDARDFPSVLEVFPMAVVHTMLTRHRGRFARRFGTIVDKETVHEWVVELNRELVPWPYRHMYRVVKRNPDHFMRALIEARMVKDGLLV